MKDEKYITENMKKEFDRSAPDDFETLMERAENYIPDENTVTVVYEKRRTGKIIAGIVSSAAVMVSSFILLVQNRSDIRSGNPVSETLYSDDNGIAAVSEFSDKEIYEITETKRECAVMDISESLATAKTMSTADPSETKTISTADLSTVKTADPSETKTMSTAATETVKVTTTAVPTTSNNKYTSSPSKTTTISAVTTPKQTATETKEITEKYTETLPVTSSATVTLPPSETLYQFPHCGGDKTLKRSELIELSKKGDELDWSDFEEYGAIDTGSGIFVLEYMIDEVEDYRLVISGARFENKPQSITLVHDLCSEEGRFGDGKEVDIRKTDMEKFFDCGKMPFDFKKDDIASVSVTSCQYNKKVEITAEKDMKDLVRLINDLIIYEEDDSYQMYDGDACLFTIVMNDGSSFVIMTYSPFVIINGTGYRADNFTGNALDSFGISKLS